MSIFKHETTNKCLTFGDFGSSFNNNFITLEQCPDLILIHLNMQIQIIINIK